MNVQIHQVKTRIWLIAIVFTILSCKKDKDQPNADSFGTSLWYGNFYDKGKLGNTDTKLAAIRIQPDGTFTWYDVHNSLKGTWSKEDNKVDFQFSSGAKNRWSATIEGDKLKNIIGPVPDNFYFATITKAAEKTPGNLVNTRWEEPASSKSLIVVAGEDGSDLNMLYGNSGSNGYPFRKVDPQVYQSATNGLVVFIDEDEAVAQYTVNTQNGLYFYSVYFQYKGPFKF